MTITKQSHVVSLEHSRLFWIEPGGDRRQSVTGFRMGVIGGYLCQRDGDKRVSQRLFVGNVVLTEVKNVTIKKYNIDVNRAWGEAIAASYPTERCFHFCNGLFFQLQGAEWCFKPNGGIEECGLARRAKGKAFPSA